MSRHALQRDAQEKLTTVGKLNGHLCPSGESRSCMITGGRVPFAVFFSHPRNDHGEPSTRPRQQGFLLATASGPVAPKHAPKTRQAAANDAVKKANDDYNTARAAADNDKFMKELEGKLNAILEAMGEKGFTNPLGIETLPGGKYGKILVGHGTDALGQTFKNKIWPGTNYLTHAHHIVMRNGPKNADAAKAVADSQAILRKWNIGIDSKENMVWAPNRGHTINYAKNVLAALQDANTDALALEATDPAGAKRIIIERLKLLAENFIRGTNI